jgi:hypothetical protein
MDSRETVKTHLTNLALRIEAQVAVTIELLGAIGLDTLMTSEHLDALEHVEEKMTELVGYAKEKISRLTENKQAVPIMELTVDQSELQQLVIKRLEEVRIALEMAQPPKRDSQ